MRDRREIERGTGWLGGGRAKRASTRWWMMRIENEDGVKFGGLTLAGRRRGIGGNTEGGRRRGPPTLAAWPPVMQSRAVLDSLAGAHRLLPGVDGCWGMGGGRAAGRCAGGIDGQHLSRSNYLFADEDKASTIRGQNPTGEQVAATCPKQPPCATAHPTLTAKRYLYLSIGGI